MRRRTPSGRPSPPKTAAAGRWHRRWRTESHVKRRPRYDPWVRMTSGRNASSCRDGVFERVVNREHLRPDRDPGRQQCARLQVLLRRFHAAAARSDEGLTVPATTPHDSGSRRAIPFGVSRILEERGRVVEDRDRHARAPGAVQMEEVRSPRDIGDEALRLAVEIGPLTTGRRARLSAVRNSSGANPSRRWTSPVVRDVPERVNHRGLDPPRLVLPDGRRRPEGIASLTPKLPAEVRGPRQPARERGAGAGREVPSTRPATRIARGAARRPGTSPGALRRPRRGPWGSGTTGRSRSPGGRTMRAASTWRIAASARATTSSTGRPGARSGRCSRARAAARGEAGEGGDTAGGRRRQLQRDRARPTRPAAGTDQVVRPLGLALPREVSMAEVDGGRDAGQPLECLVQEVRAEIHLVADVLDTFLRARKRGPPGWRAMARRAVCVGPRWRTAPISRRSTATQSRISPSRVGYAARECSGCHMRRPMM